MMGRGKREPLARTLAAAHQPGLGGVLLSSAFLVLSLLPAALRWVRVPGTGATEAAHRPPSSQLPSRCCCSRYLLFPSQSQSPREPRAWDGLLVRSRRFASPTRVAAAHGNLAGPRHHPQNDRSATLSGLLLCGLPPSPTQPSSSAIRQDRSHTKRHWSLPAHASGAHTPLLCCLSALGDSLLLSHSVVAIWLLRSIPHGQDTRG